MRKAYPVPLHLDPKNPADWNYKPSGVGHVSLGGASFAEGAIVVAHADGKHESRDIIFEGPPTPGMEPIDDEAKELSAGIKWRDPMDSAYTEMSFAEKMLADLQGQMAEALTQVGAVRAAPADAVISEMRETMNMMAQLMTQNTQLLQQMVQQPQRRL